MQLPTAEGDLDLNFGCGVAQGHTLVPIQQAMKIPRARDAVDAERGKLDKKRAWLLGTAQPKSRVIECAKWEGKTIQFGSLKDLCCVKHSELPEYQRK